MENNSFRNEYYIKDIPIAIGIGNVRACFTDTIDANNTRKVKLLQTNAYYPFGMTMTLGNNDNKYKYNGKELQDDFGLEWYDYGARFYDVQLGRFHTLDPHTENYYSWTPYNYVANNPIIMIDPNGMDWYTSENGSATMWRKGSGNIGGYSNIGTSYTQNIGDGVFITYNQNEAVSMNEEVLQSGDWETQRTRDENGNNVSKEGDAGNCYKQSKKMAENGGANPIDGYTNGISTGTESANANGGYSVNATTTAQQGGDYIDSQINQGNPVVIGVDKQFGRGVNDGTTDHYVTISSRTTNLKTGNKNYDPGTISKSKGTNANNSLSMNSKGLLTGTTTYSGKTYTVTYVKKNK